MRSQNQILMVALAVVFAIALALTVALICLSAMQEPESNRKEPATLPYSPDTAPFYPDSQPTYVTTEVLPALTEPATDSGNGLLFLRTGNGCCTLTGLGTCTDAFVVIPEYAPSGDRVTAIAERALMGCTGITAIQLPSTVHDIGALAFANCPNLIYISVSERNPAYRDREGVLYSADGRTLILYPAMHAGGSVYIPANVTRIEDMAFYRCAYLSSVCYAGSAEQWDRISIGSKNYSLTAASVDFQIQ